MIYNSTPLGVATSFKLIKCLHYLDGSYINMS